MGDDVTTVHINPDVFNTVLRACSTITYSVRTEALSIGFAFLYYGHRLVYKLAHTVGHNNPLELMDEVAMRARASWLRNVENELGDSKGD
jgi:hypothetical protein